MPQAVSAVLDAPVLQPFNRWQSTKGLAAATVLVLFFFTGFPRELSALAVAGVLLCSRRMKSRQILTLVDWHLITLFCALFIVIEGISLQGVPDRALARMTEGGVSIQNLYILSVTATVLSNLVSNVPAVMLMVRFLDAAIPVAMVRAGSGQHFCRQPDPDRLHCQSDRRRAGPYLRNRNRFSRTRRHRSTGDPRFPPHTGGLDCAFGLKTRPGPFAHRLTLAAIACLKDRKRNVRFFLPLKKTE